MNTENEIFAYYSTLPMLSREKEHGLWQEYFSNDTTDAKKEKIRQDIINAHGRMVVNFVKKQKGYDISPLELFSEGMEGLTKAFDKYRMDRNARFSTYSYQWVQSQVYNHILSNVSQFKFITPIEKYLFFNYVKLKDEIQTENPDASNTEIKQILAEKLAGTKQISGWPQTTEKALENIEIYLSKRYGGQSANQTISNDNETELIDLLNDRSSPSPEKIVLNKLFKEAAARFVIDAEQHFKKKGKERSWYILKHRRLAEEGEQKTLEDLGNEYGVSKERIRQIEVSAFNLLMKFAKSSGVMKYRGTPEASQTNGSIGELNI